MPSNDWQTTQMESRLLPQSDVDYYTLLGPEGVSAQRLRHVYRFSSIPTHHRESVAEHCYFVSLYSLLMADAYERSQDPKNFVSVDRGRLLQRCVLHDIDEALTGDFLRMFKYSSPELHNEIKKATCKLASKFFLILAPGTDKIIAQTYFDEWLSSKKEDIEGRIIAFVDLLTVVMYCVMEVRMGNRYLVPILSECFGYIKQVVDQGEVGKSKGFHEFMKRQYRTLARDTRRAIESSPSVAYPEIDEF